MADDIPYRDSPDQEPAGAPRAARGRLSEPLDVRLPETSSDEPTSSPLAAPLNAAAQWSSPKARVREEVRPPEAGEAPESRAYRAMPESTSEGLAGFNFPGRIKRTVLPLPGSAEKPSTFSVIWFALAFVIPVVLGTIYYMLIASNQYVCEFRFSARQPVYNGSSPSLTNGLTSILQSAAPSNPDLLDNYTIVDYVSSEQAARDLQARLNLKSMYDNSNIDWVSRFSSHGSAERLARYWNKMVYSEFDPATGLAIVRVRAFTPEDSLKIATQLLATSKDIVNEIGLQSQKDSVSAARVSVERIEKEVAGIESKMTDLRLQTNTVDPTVSVVSGNAGLATSLRANIAQIESQITALMTQTRNGSAPQINALKAQLTGAQKQLESVAGEVNSSNGSMNLARIAGEFEVQTNALQNEEQLLLAAQNNLLQSEVGLDSSRIYLTTYVKPTLPESSNYPRRWLAILELILGCAMVWLIGLLVSNSVIEHAS